MAYPGLVTGTGLVHNSKGIEGGFNLGMHFDYTTGMPIVYGSSVKGVLRSYFIDFCTDESICKEIGFPCRNIEEANDLWEDIFHGKRRNKAKDTYHEGKLKEKGYDNVSIYERDIFFDAVIIEKAKNGRFLEDDSITPHGDNPLKNPKPIAMLKIASGCKMEFRFRLHNSPNFSKDNKEKLFIKILTTMGIGAKTNVGYGQFE